jgi:hypothetical protein
VRENDGSNQKQEHGGDEVAVPATPQHKGGHPPTQAETDAQQSQYISDLQKEAVRRERGTFRIAKFGFVIAAVSLAISTMQWWVMRQQLYDARAESEESRETTARLLSANETLAAAAARQAADMQALVSANKAMADAAKISAENSVRIARSGEQSIQTARDSLRLEQRAWLGIERIDGAPQVGSHWNIAVIVRNSGRTPAEHVVGQVVVDPMLNGARPDFTYRADEVLHTGDVPPGGVFTLRLVPLIADKATGRVKMVDEEVERLLREGTLDVYVHGRISYGDVFGRRHTVPLCQMYTPDIRAFSMCSD